jgi:hypothetical protein
MVPATATASCRLLRSPAFGEREPVLHDRHLDAQLVQERLTQLKDAESLESGSGTVAFVGLIHTLKPEDW